MWQVVSNPPQLIPSWQELGPEQVIDESRAEAPGGNLHEPRPLQVTAQSLPEQLPPPAQLFVPEQVSLVLGALELRFSGQESLPEHSTLQLLPAQ
jgi:hypothetical protein